MSLALFIVAIIFFLFSLVILERVRNHYYRHFLLLAIFSLFAWSFALAIFYFFNQDVLLWLRCSYVLASCVILSLVLFVLVYPQHKDQPQLTRWVLCITPFFLGAWIYSIATPWVIESVRLNPLAIDFGIGYGLWLINVLILISFLLFRLISTFKSARGLLREKVLYLLASSLFFIFFISVTNFILPYIHFLELLWLGPILAILWVLSVLYLVTNHVVIDLRLMLIRVSIFLFVYSILFLATFYLAYQLMGWGVWVWPMMALAILSFLGHVVYAYLQNRAEDGLLNEQRRYQNTLRNASSGMGRVKDLKKLLAMICYVLTKTVKLTHTLIYMYDASEKKFVLGASKVNDSGRVYPYYIADHDILLDYMQRTRQPIIADRIKDLPLSDEEVQSLSEAVLLFDGQLFYPIIIERDLIGIIVMGGKENKHLFSEDDLVVFSILCNQVALAIENAQFYEEMKIKQQQLFQAEKMATIGTMADGLSHQINNRFHAMGFIAGDALDTIVSNKDSGDNEKLKQALKDLEVSLNRIQDNVIQGGEIVQGLLRYTRKGDSGHAPVDVDAVLRSAMEMIQFKIKPSQMLIERCYDSKVIPRAMANYTQLQEVFMNIIDNAFDAMLQKKTEMNVTGYMPTLKIYIEEKDQRVRIIFEDTGMGVKDEDLAKLFTPFFTTKFSTKKGTGLGLYVIKKIIEENHQGHVEFITQYGQGSQLKLSLPLAT